MSAPLDLPEPPADIELEQALLGAILVNNAAYHAVSEFLRPKHFANAVHGRIFETIGTAIEQGAKADVVMVRQVLGEEPVLVPLGGTGAYLAKLLGAAVTVVNAPFYGKQLLKIARRRALHFAGKAIIDDAEAGKPVEEIMAQALADLAEAAEPPQRLHVINPAIWQDQPTPERRWIVPNWIPIGVASGLYGPPGHGKTLLLQQLMTAGDLGKPWIGCPVAQLKSIAFLCEDDEDELHRRQDAINRVYGCEFRDLGERVRLVPRLGYDNTMLTFKDGRPVRTDFYDQVLGEALSFGAQLVIIDTVADTFGGDQNNMGHARQYVQALAAIARAIDGAIIASAHPSQSGKANGSGESGSVQWDAAFRSRLYLETPEPDDGEAPDENARVLTRKKANYASRNETIEMRWQDGVFISTKPPSGILGSIERRTCERVFLDLLAKTTAEAQPVSSNIYARNYAPKMFAARPDREGFKKSDFARAMQTLFMSKQIINIAYGRKSDERTRLARVENGSA